jgi:YD repeat-containing protein
MRMTCHLRRRDPGALVLAFTLLMMSPQEAVLAANGSVAYSYDALGRVTAASYDTGVCVMYSYDPNGNRLSETILVTSSGSTGVWGCFNWNQAKWGP